MSLRLAGSLVAIALILSACGTSPQERAVTGGAIGAAGGAIAGAVVGVPLVGAAVGAAAGSAVGALTVPSDIELGKPIWKWQGAK